MTITLIYRGEEQASAETEITDAGDRRDPDREDAPEPAEFEIATINGESADRVNAVEFHDDAPITIELDGVDVSAHRFNVTIGDYHYSLFPDEDGVLAARRENPREGRYTMTVTLTHRGDAFASAETEIEITDAGDRRDPDREEPPEPAEFEIATINGESADRVNAIEFHDDAPITIELTASTFRPIVSTSRSATITTASFRTTTVC